MRSRFSHVAVAMLFAVALLPGLPSVARAITQPPEQLSPREQIVAGVSQIGGGLSVSRVSALRPELFPLVWASSRAAGGGVLDLPGTLPVPGWAGPFGAGRVAIWAGHEGFFGASGDGRLDNELFRENLTAWLLGGGDRLGVSSGHQEWLTLANLSPELSQALETSRVEVGELPAELTPDVLAHYDALLIGNPWGEFGTSELDALAQWVEAGGGLLVLGLGWSWHQNHSEPSGALYPVNRLGAIFGWRVEDGQISDAGSPNGSQDEPAFMIQPLADYLPGCVIVLPAAQFDVDIVQRIAVEQPRDIFMIQGKYMGLQLPTDKWVQLDSPSKALAILDRAYETQLALVGGANRPFGGSVVWYAAADDPQGAYWMHSGNPIIYKQEAADEIIGSLNAGWPGWGMLHELGHNFVASACGNLFVHSNTDEPWCNVFAVWSIAQNGWPERADAFDAGHALNSEAQPDLAQVTSDPWPLLGCLELVWSRYGWDGMQRFMTRAATDSAAGVSTDGDAERTDYFALQLSQAYGVDLSPTIRHWGFTVSDSVAQQTATLPPAQL